MEALYSFLGLTAEDVKKKMNDTSYWLVSYNSEETQDNMCLVRAPSKGKALLRYFKHTLNEKGLWELADIFNMTQELPKYLRDEEKALLGVDDDDITYGGIERIFLELNDDRLVEILLSFPTVKISLLKNIPRI